MSSVAKWEDQNYNDTRRVEIWQRSCLFINRFLSLATQFIPSICIFKGKEVTAPCRPKTIPWEIDDVVSYSHHQLHRLRKKGVWKQYCSVWSIFHWPRRQVKAAPKQRACLNLSWPEHAWNPRRSVSFIPVQTNTFMSIFTPFKASCPVVTQNASSTEGGSILWLCSREDISQSREGRAGVPLFAGVTLRAGLSGVCFWLLMCFFFFFFS